MATLSVVLIVKNAEQELRQALESAKWADEIIVYDSGSEDATRSIAAEYTSHVIVDTDWQGFGLQRQKAQAHASGDWVLMLDADEVISEPLADEIRALIKDNNQQFYYEIPRLSWVFGRFIRHSGWYPDCVIRLYPREKAAYNDALVHEKVVAGAELSLGRLSSDLLHYTYRDLEHYLVKSAGYAKAWADQRELRGKKTTIRQGVLHAVGCFVKMYILRMGFLDGRAGLVLALLSAHSTFAKYADLAIRAMEKKSSS